MPSSAASADRIKRLLGTAFGFVSFASGAVVLAGAVVPVIWLTQRNAQRRAMLVRRSIAGAFRLHVRALQAIGALSFELKNLAALRPGQLVVANHPSLLDVVFLVGFIDNAACVVKDSLFHNIWMGFLIRLANYVSNRDPEALVKACSAALERGETVIIFPEGTRTSEAVLEGATPRLQRGAAYVSLAARVPITPIRIHCEPRALAKGQPWYAIAPRKMRYEFAVLDDIPVPAGTSANPGLDARLINREIVRVLFDTRCNLEDASARRAEVADADEPARKKTQNAIDRTIEDRTIDKTINTKREVRR